MLPMPVMTLMMVVVVRCGGVDSNEAGHIWAYLGTIRHFAVLLPNTFRHEINDISGNHT